MLVREHWQVLERVVLILTQEGGAGLTLAASWCGTPDEALDGLSPAAWLERGRDPQTLYLRAGMPRGSHRESLQAFVAVSALTRPESQTGSTSDLRVAARGELPRATPAALFLVHCDSEGA
jgi:hypothetical protein